ncbi:MAG: peptidoglycan bridge formation glycyltransferase FemA/FemB family protein, partial [Candidatus Nealsonbacteria bacterium]|nr:peptidoglycan bridge formation glycyltransferase FemA/FemB family protein [Candidatus Nealsonbacteria bacterium]
QEAKSRSFGYYDFGGVDAEKWPGLSRFKQGFGGMLFEYPPVIDIVYRPFMYAVYNTARKIL